MKISLNGIKQIYAQSKASDFLPKDIGKVAQKIGAQLGEIEEIVELGKKYEGVLAVKVITCEKHPNADRLSVCLIDDGGVNRQVKRNKDGLVQVVCGAPNVKAGMLAAWIPPGLAVPSTFDKEPFVLEARDIRGETSNGMLASANELGINDDHTGILAIDKDVKPGTPFVEVYKLDDYIIEIENKMFTHRPDCFGLLGIARELAGIYDKPFTSPDWFVQNPKPLEAGTELKLEVKNEIPELVPRFTMVAIADVKIGPSPFWLQVALSKAGIKSINNIVDLTNFYMYYTGQPLHAYDYDKVAKLSSNGAKVHVRKAKAGEKLKMLNGKQLTALDQDIMIATDQTAIGVGGVIGGSQTEVDDSTKNIILECANFDSYTIRRTSMHHGIFTDAVTRFTKGQSPHQNLAVLSKVAADIAAFAGGHTASPVFDLKGKLEANKPIKVSADFINSRLGVKLKAEQIKAILQNVEFEVKNSGHELAITAPFWRTDIEIPEDIVEEVGRLYGYDHLPLELPKKTMAASVVSDELKVKDDIRSKLAALGANEVLSYSFIKGGLLQDAGQSEKKSYKIKNALSPDLEYYRQSLTPSLLEKIHPNIKAGFDNLALFELGKVHIKGKETDGLPDEFGRLALVAAHKKKQPVPAYYLAKKYLVELLAGLDIVEDQLSLTPIKTNHDPDASYYEPSRAADVHLNGELIGRIGEYGARVAQALKLPDFCAGFEIDLRILEKHKAVSTYKPLSRYPATEQDICLRTKSDKTYYQIKSALQAALDKNAPEDLSYGLECIDIFSAGDGHKQTTFRVSASSYERTLTSEVINLLFEKAAIDLGKSIGADIV